jgi:hypothetical protein
MTTSHDTTHETFPTEDVQRALDALDIASEAPAGQERAWEIQTLGGFTMVGSPAGPSVGEEYTRIDTHYAFALRPDGWLIFTAGHDGRVDTHKFSPAETAAFYRFFSFLALCKLAVMKMEGAGA